MANLKYRVLLILGLFAASAWALFPRTVVERVKRNGVFVYDTVKRVPLKRGLDLQGGMHLTLEVDESKQVVANKSAGGPEGRGPAHHRRASGYRRRRTGSGRGAEVGFP